MRGVSTKPPLRRGHRPRPTMRGAIIGAVVVLGAGIAAWFFWSGDKSPLSTSASTSTSRIKEVTPAQAAKAVSAPETPKDPPGYWNGKKISNENRPPWMSPYHTINDYGEIQKHKIDPASLPIYKRIFTEETDQDIASLILIDPGESMLGDGKGLYENFDEFFIASLKTPITITPNDTEDEKLLKEAVIGLRKSLKERYDKGESVQKIMEDSDRELRELGLYKEELKKQVENICETTELTESDLDDCIEAANLMLSDRGCSPLTFPEFFRKSVMLQSERIRKGLVDEE